MCGIAFWSKARHDSEILDSRALAAALLTSIQARGRDAAGAAWTSARTRLIDYQKGQVTGATLAKQLTIPHDAVQGILHTRYATKGSPSDDVNNHPIIRPGIVLVHNGWFTNDDTLFARLGVDRIGRVDSEVMAASLMGKGTLQERLAAPQGPAAILWMDVLDQTNGNPQVVHVARLSHSPLTIGFTRAGDVIGASTDSLLSAACKAAGVTLTKMTDLAPWTYLKVRRGQIEKSITLSVPAWDKPVKATPKYRPTVVSTVKRESIPDQLARMAQNRASKRGAILFPDKAATKHDLQAEWALDEEDWRARLEWRAQNEWRGSQKELPFGGERLA